MSPVIRPLSSRDRAAFEAHFARHRAESGQGGDVHFMPFEPGDPLGPSGLDGDALTRPLSDLRWQRWFVAFSDHRNIVGHVNLTGDTLRVGRHRCELGIGIERSHRARGLGRRLMTTAMEFAEASGSLAWIDLRVFAHNVPARALYRALGFEEIGTIADRFRIGGTSVDDVMMTLRLPG